MMWFCGIICCLLSIPSAPTRSSLPENPFSPNRPHWKWPPQPHGHTPGHVLLGLPLKWPQGPLPSVSTGANPQWHPGCWLQAQMATTPPPCTPGGSSIWEAWSPGFLAAWVSPQARWLLLFWQLFQVNMVRPLMMGAEGGEILQLGREVTVMSDSLWPHGLHSPWNPPVQNTGVGRLSLLQGIFPTQG